MKRKKALHDVVRALPAYAHMSRQLDKGEYLRGMIDGLELAAFSLAGVQYRRADGTRTRIPDDYSVLTEEEKEKNRLIDVEEIAGWWKSWESWKRRKSA